MAFQKRTVVWTVVFIFVGVFTWLIAAVVTAKREFHGSLETFVGTQENANISNPLDHVITRNVRIEISVAGDQGVKQVTSSHVWRDQTDKKRSFSIRLSGPGTGNVDLTTGKIELQLSFQFEFPGYNLTVPVTLTTESSNDIFGTISGKRADFKPHVRSATVRLVGSGQVPVQKRDVGLDEEGQTVLGTRIIVDGVVKAVD